METTFQALEKRLYKSRQNVILISADDKKIKIFIDGKI